MKKRILSMLLLVALLVTGIPVMAISASDTEETIEYVTDITTLYVGADGSTTEGGATLVGLYTAFKDEANAYDLTAGKWFNKMDKATEDRATDAILRDNTDAAAWAATANGGLTAGISTKAIYDAVGYSIGIDLPVAWAEADNALVETTAVATGLTGVTGVTIGPGNADETFRFGVLRGFFEPSVNAEATEGATLNVIFRAQNSAWYDTTGRNANFRQACGVSGLASNSDKSKFAATGLTMYMQRTTVDNAVSYTVSYNGSLAITQSAIKDNTQDPPVTIASTGGTFCGVSGGPLSKVAAEGETSAYDALLAAIPAKATNFSLFNRASMDVYTIRVYTGGVLTEAEKQLNHLVDLCGYYGVGIPVALSDAQLAALASAHAADVFATEDDDTKGTANFSAVKKSLEDDIAAVLAEAELSAPTGIDYAALYVGANGEKTANGASLVGLFTAFAGDKAANEADVAAGKWTNKIATEADDDISLLATAGTSWNISTNGGLLANGVSTANWNNSNVIRMDLTDDWAALANFTLESSIIMHGVKTTATHVPQAGGVDIEHMRLDLLHFHHLGGILSSEKLSGGGTWQANTTTAYWDTSCRDQVWRALFDNNAQTAGGETFWASKTTGADGSVTYATEHSYNQTISGNRGKVGGATYTADEYAAAASTRDFYLFASMAVEVYAVRLYDGTLTDAEKQYNHFIDLLGFYQIDIPEGLDVAGLATLAAKYYTTTFVMDNNKAADDYKTVCDSINEDLTKLAALSTPATLTAYDKLYAAQENLVGLFTTFSADDDSVILDLMTWKNKVAGGEHATLYNSTSATITAGENGGVIIGGFVDTAYNTYTTKVGIRLSDRYADFESFTVEHSSVLYGMFPATKGENDEDVPVKDNIAGDYQTFRFGALNADLYPNMYATDNAASMALDWQNNRIAASKNWWDGQRDTTYKAAYNAAGSTATGLTQTVTMAPTTVEIPATETADATSVDGKIYGVYYGTKAVSFNSAAKMTAAITLEDYAKEMTNTKVAAFSLFNGTPADVYAIRVYNKVLNAEEMAQNHFVDLLAFYGIAVPDGLTADTFAPFAPAAAELADLPFYTDEAKATEAKAAIEASIEAVDKVVLLDDATDAPFATIYAVNGEVALPLIIDGRTVIAYADMEMNYVFPGAKIAVEGTVTYYAIGTAEPIISTDEKVDMKLYEETVGEGDEATTEQKLGIRFNATVNFAALQEKLDLMNEFIADESLKIAIKNYGILVAPKAYVEAAGAFTVEALDAYAAANGSTAGAYVAISSEEWYDTTDAAAYKLVGGLVDFSAASIENNVEFAAIAFIELDVDEDPYSDTIVYGAYNADACVTLKAAAENALDGMEVTAPEYAALNELLARFSGESEE